MRYAFYWTFVYFLISSVALAEDFHGTVRSEVGGPLAGTLDEESAAIVVRSGASTMMLAWGEFWSWGIPGPAFFEDISQLRERSLDIGGNVTVAESRGTRPDGSFRYVGLYGETISYESADTAAAEYFDRIIDSLCWARVPTRRMPPR